MSPRLRAAALTLTIVTTFAPATAARAAFPTEPNRILFSRGTGDDAVVLRSIRSDGGADRLVLDRFAEQWAGRWSPDGSRIVFTETHGAPLANAEIRTVRPDGTGARRITRNDVIDWQPAWSPDGSRIVWSRFDQTAAKLMVARADGSRPHAIHSGDVEIYFPVWSPDGRWIAFTAFDGNDFEIWLIRPDGTRRHRLTDTGADEFGGDFSPNGKRFVYTRLSATGGTIRLADVDGSGGRIVADETDTGPLGFGVVFLPRGDRLAVVGLGDGPDTEIFAMRLDGTGVRQLTDNDVEDELVFIEA
jgi:Tol biopolymer transport system component